MVHWLKTRAIIRSVHYLERPKMILDNALLQRLFPEESARRRLKLLSTCLSLNHNTVRTWFKRKNPIPTVHQHSIENLLQVIHLDITEGKRQERCRILGKSFIAYLVKIGVDPLKVQGFALLADGKTYKGQVYDIENIDDVTGYL